MPWPRYRVARRAQVWLGGAPWIQTWNAREEGFPAVQLFCVFLASDDKSLLMHGFANMTVFFVLGTVVW